MRVTAAEPAVIPHTIAGWAILIGLPSLAWIVKVYASRIIKRLDEADTLRRRASEEAFARIDQQLAQQRETDNRHGDALAEATRGLALLVREVEPMNDRLTVLESGHNTLERNTAVLREKIDQHIRWSEQENDRLQGRRGSHDGRASAG